MKSDITPEELFRLADALPACQVRDLDLTELAAVAALAWDYASKVEAGTASGLETATLVCHAKVLADDLYHLAKSLTDEDRADA